MNRTVLHNPLGTWVRLAIVLTLVIGSLWGSFQGVSLAVEKGYVQLVAPALTLYAIKSQLNTALASTGIACALGLLTVLACYGFLTIVPVPGRRTDIGAVVWTVTLMACVFVGYRLNKTDWFPHFWSVGGVLGNALVVGVFAAIGTAAWISLERIMSRIGSVLDGVARLLPIRVGLALGVYVLAINAGFYALKLQSTSQAQAADRTSPRLVVIGLDGASWKALNPLIRQGRLPNISRLMAGGTYGPLETFEPTLSPIIWTTVATGKPMSQHGITGFAVQQGPDKGKLMTSNMRRSKALWNILSEHERSVGVVGWFVTWPAEAVNGVMVSSYTGLGRIHKGRLHKDIPEQTYPRELIQQLEPSIQRAEGELEQRFTQVFPRLAMDELSASQQGVVEDTREVLLADLLNVQAAVDLLGEKAPDFFALYLGGIDVISHRFWKYKHPGDLAYDVSGRQVAMLADAIDNYIVLTDQLVGRVMAASGDDTLFLVMSDHGMGPYIPEDGNHDRLSGHHHDAPAGIVILSGEHVHRGPLPARASVYDIAPTILHLFDLPLAEDMAGLPMLAAFDEAFRDDRTPQYVRSYETNGTHKRVQAARESHVDEHLKARLESLGYL
jgi:predicted AlkP superfamily phosphohydrolase/phosphomutase